MMGLQATANKRKHEITMCNGEEDDLQSNYIPMKTCRLSKDTDLPASNNNVVLKIPTPNVSLRIPSPNLTLRIPVPSLPSSPPPPPTQSSSVTENSIAKLEAVTVPGETWSNNNSNNINNNNNNNNSNNNTSDQQTNTDNSIQRLQAVAVPGERWLNECSTLAATLLANDVDDDDDDFEDDFEDEDADIPNFPLVRYPCSSHGYVHPGYQKNFGYYNESYPQHNCSKPPIITRTNSSYYGGWNHYYNHPDSSPANNTQQTIRCAENGKSYLELGSANYNPTPNNINLRAHKRCCDGKSNLCNTRQCYKERRLKIMNLSMFKLSRFRQISEQSLYRSVLICNTLKLIEKEIEHEAKENNNNNNNSINGMQQHHTGGTTTNSTNGTRVSNLTSNKLNNNNNNNSCNHNNNSNSINNNINSSNSRLNNGVNIINRNCNQESTLASLQLQTPIISIPSIKIFNNNNNSNQNNNNDSGSLNTYDSSQHNPFRDLNSGRVTPFPSLSLPDTDSGFGDEDCSRPINWGSVLSLSSQSATDPLNNHDFYSSISSSLSSNTFTTTASATYWDCNIFESDLSLDKNDFTELLPSWKLTPLSADDILKSVPPPMEPSKIVHDNEIDNFTHIMVGS